MLTKFFILITILLMREFQGGIYDETRT